MQHTDPIDDAPELALNEDGLPGNNENAPGDRLRRAIDCQVDALDGMLGANLRLIQSTDVLRRMTREKRWDEMREAYLKEREKYLQRRETAWAKKENLNVRDPRRTDQEDNLWSPLLLGVVVLWKLMTRPSKQEG